MGRWLALLALLCAAVACEPAWSVQGQVHADGVDRRPLRGATAALRCPGQQDLSATTDHEGVFELGGRGPGPGLDCAVVIAAPAFSTARIPLVQACEDAREDPPGRCEVAMVDAVLSRR
ncbi:MAG TPA: hypothetical protein VE964_09815 [Myxococcales bacterium]|nr:hypothetical protein [Myxococcales bacterium]